MNGIEDYPGRIRGFSLLDAVIALAVFVLGVLAFAQFQTSLMRSNTDARLRTLASNVAEQTIETQRRFVRLDTDPEGNDFAYDDIGSRSETKSISGVNFMVEQKVTPYYWSSANQQFEATPDASRPYSDFKLLEVSVSWENPLKFQLGGAPDDNNRLGSGSISISTIISSAVTATGRLALIDDLSGNPLYLPLAALPPVLSESPPPEQTPTSTTPLVTTSPITIPWLPGFP